MFYIPSYYVINFGEGMTATIVSSVVKVWLLPRCLVWLRYDCCLGV